MSESEAPRPKRDWRQWRQFLHECNRILGKQLFDGSIVGQNTYLEFLCNYVWDSADAPDENKQKCLEIALQEAGFKIDRQRTNRMVAGGDFGAVQIKKLGFVMLYEGKFKVVRPSKTTGCMITLIVVGSASYEAVRMFF